MTTAEVSVGELKARFPEFCDAPDTLVKAVIAEACRCTPADIWGDKLQDGTLYQAAHLLSISPLARSGGKCCDADGMSSYKRERKRLECLVSSGFRVTGSDC